MLAACGMLWWIQLPGQTQDAPQTAQGVPASLDGERGGVTYVGTQPLPVVEVTVTVPFSSWGLHSSFNVSQTAKLFGVPMMVRNPAYFP